MHENVFWRCFSEEPKQRTWGKGHRVLLRFPRTTWLLTCPHLHRMFRVWPSRLGFGVYFCLIFHPLPCAPPTTWHKMGSPRRNETRKYPEAGIRNVTQSPFYPSLYPSSSFYNMKMSILDLNILIAVIDEWRVKNHLPGNVGSFLLLGGCG